MKLKKMKHRKLLPSTNTSMGCPDDSCYFSDYFFPPPPPLPPPPVSGKHGVSVSPYVVVIATLLGVTLLILTYYFAVVKNCGGRGCFRLRRRQQGGTEEDFLDDHGGGVGIDHPIWYIRTIGLQPSVIDSITVFKYKKGDSFIEAPECSVCLTEFQDDEILRLLPKCSHAFHIPCIDTWLRSHINCPVCRASIFVSSGVVAQEEEHNPEEITDIIVDRQEAENGPERSESEVEERVEFPESPEEDDHDAVCVINDFEVTNNKVKRSVSADSSVIAKIRLAMESLPMAELEASEVSNNGVEKSRMHQRESDDDGDEHVAVKRSVSYGGRSFILRN